MGTRHLICVVSNGEYKVAQYGQWDGYPSGQGSSILRFLQSDQLAAFKENLPKCSWISEDDIAKYWSEFGVNIRENGSVSYEIYNKFSAKYPQLSRDTGADVLKVIASAPDGVKLRNDYDFSRDSLFCEWAYVIDFDKNTFEVYQGFNEKPLDKSERFYSEVLTRYSSNNTYYPVKLLTSFDLSNLPSEDEFLKVCEPPEDEDEEEAVATTATAS